ncbi:MAG: hypothetical protein IJ928_11800, partial [Prevotella sp.]|nr:hypothetical protein [Prevotella sp.]
AKREAEGGKTWERAAGEGLIFPFHKKNGQKSWPFDKISIPLHRISQKCTPVGIAQLVRVSP